MMSTMTAVLATLLMRFSFVFDIYLRIIRICLDSLIRVRALFTLSQRGKIPPIMDRVLLQSALDLSSQIKAGKLKSEDLVKAFIDRIKTVQPFVNAIVDQRFAEAVLEAIEVDKRVVHQLNGNGPLNGVSIHDQPFLGVPVSIKDSVGVKGMAYDCGLEYRKGLKGDIDAKVVQLLRESGAIPLVMTNTPEVTMWWSTYNKLYGQTNNPYDLSRIPGGSSGGESALIASAASVIGVGSDIGGSIRFPSFCCGIFGHKPTPGIVPGDNQYPPMTPENVSFLSMGPMTRYCSDILPMLKVMAAPNLAKLKLDEKVDLSKVKIYFMEESGNPFETPVDTDIKQGINALVNHFSHKFGNETKKVSFNQMRNGFLVWVYALKHSNILSFDRALLNGNGSTSIGVVFEFIKYFLNISKHTFNVLSLNAIYKCTPSVRSGFGQRYVRLGRELKQEFKQLLGNDGVFIYPTHPEPALNHFLQVLKLPNVSYTAIFNALGVPVTNCPLGLNRNGLPIGVQVVSTPYNDHLTIAVANELEKAFGGWVSPSKIVC